MTVEEVIKEGDSAPDFMLKDQDDNEFNLTGFKGKNVLLKYGQIFFNLELAHVCPVMIPFNPLIFNEFIEDVLP